MEGTDDKGRSGVILRSLLSHYVLSSISAEPRRGYEILQYVGDKALAEAGAAPRPSVDSLYPLLKKMLAEGYVRTDAKGSARASSLYSITQKGSEALGRQGDGASNSERRRIALEALNPLRLGVNHFGSPKEQFEASKALFEAKRAGMMSRGDADSMLREYTSSLERRRLPKSSDPQKTAGRAAKRLE